MQSSFCHLKTVRLVKLVSCSNKGLLFCYATLCGKPLNKVCLSNGVFSNPTQTQNFFCKTRPEAKKITNSRWIFLLILSTKMDVFLCQACKFFLEILSICQAIIHNLLQSVQILTKKVF